MAIDFPDFLRVPVTPRDYSGVSDAISNYYAGYNMPKDAMIKAVQAKFAQPNAEADLRATQLRNAYQAVLNQYAPESEKQRILATTLANRQAQTELNQNAELERQLRVALSGGNPGALPASSSQPVLPNATVPAPARVPMPSGAQAPVMTPQVQIPPELASRMSLINPAVMTNGGMGNAPTAPIAPSGGANAPIPPVAPVIATNALPATSSQPASDATVVAEGAPNLAGVDALYDSSPLARAFLEKKGFKKTQEVKFDNKTGRTTILTKYPSGKVTLQSSGGVGGTTQDGFPLTNKMISAHQEKIAAIDNAMPILQEIVDLDKPNKNGKSQWEPYPRSSGWRPGLGWLPGYQSASTNYEALVNSALDTLMKAYGMPSTNESLQTIKDQILIGHNETDAQYKKRLQNFMKDLQRRKAYSANEVKRSNKIQPIDTSSGGNNADNDTYSSNEWEAL